MNILVLATLQFAYAFPADPVDYNISLEFAGYLPVLGGIEQTAIADMTLRVSAATGREGQLASKVLLTEFKLAMRDVEAGGMTPLPFTVESVRPFFPEQTILYKLNGEIKSTTAPKLDLPMRLPGLSTQHVPDITFLLLQFPEKPVTAGESWEYSRKFDESPVKYTTTYKGQSPEGFEFALKLDQAYETLEDENRNPVSDTKTAKFRVKTEVKGTGTALFSGEKGILLKANVIASAVSTVLTMKGQQTGTRKLATKFLIKSKGTTT